MGSKKLAKFEKELKERKKYPKDEVFFLGQYAYRNKSKLSIEESDLLYGELRRLESQHPEMMLDIAHVYELASDFTGAERVYGTAEKLYGKKMSDHTLNSEQRQAYFDKYKTARVKHKKAMLMQQGGRHEGFLEKILSKIFSKRRKRREDAYEEEIEDSALHGPFNEPPPRHYLFIGVIISIYIFLMGTAKITGRVVDIPSSYTISNFFDYSLVVAGLLLIIILYIYNKQHR